MCVCVVCPGDIDGTLGDLGERIGAQRMTKYGDGGKDVSWGVWVGIDLKGGRETQSFGIRNVCWAGGKEGRGCQLIYAHPPHSIQRCNGTKIDI